VWKVKEDYFSAAFRISAGFVPFNSLSDAVCKKTFSLRGASQERKLPFLTQYPCASGVSSILKLPLTNPYGLSSP
jgi:hypothetical protein